MFHFIKITPFIISRFLLHLFYIFPIKNNKLFFESYSGKGYLCNPKYVSEYLNKNFPNMFKIVWSFSKPEKISESYFIKVKRNSIKYFYNRITSKIIITNVADAVYVPKRKSQILINTWHAGGAYKRVGKSFNQNKSELIKWQSKIISNNTDVFISSSKAFTKYNINEGYGYYKKILNIGMPRNDIFFNTGKMEKVIKQFNEKYGLKNIITVLFAPTFRNNKKLDTNIKKLFPLNEIIYKLENMLNKKCVILIRSHHYASNTQILNNTEHIIDVTNYPDMQELLVRADILITDYSSCMWDFSLLGKPCFLYVPDFKDYQNNRGLFTSISKWPGILCTSSKELINNLNKYNLENSNSIANKHLKLFKSYEHGKATKILCNYILKVYKN